MASFKRNKRAGARAALPVALLTAAAALSGCADYLNNWDTSSARSGNAHQANTAIQSNETWPPAAYKTTVGSGG